MPRKRQKRWGLPRQEVVQPLLPFFNGSVPPKPPPKSPDVPEAPEFPGDWRNSIQQISMELEANDQQLRKKLEEHERVRIEGREELDARANVLQVRDLLREMNEALLSGEGCVKEKFRWYMASDFDLEFDDEDEDVAVPVLSIELYWKEGRRLQFDVELVGTGDDVLLYVNRGEMPAAEPLFLQAELIRSFREQMYDDVPDDEE